MSQTIHSRIYDTLPPEDLRQNAHIYEALVVSALDQLEAHNSDQLHRLVSELSSANVPDEKLGPILRSLSREVARLDSLAAGPLIQAVLAVKWSRRPRVITDSYVRFIGVLASGIPRWWTEIADMIVSEFTLSPELTKPHHTVIKHILKYIPTSSSRFEGIFAQHFPHKMEQTKPTENFVANLLLVADYAVDQRRAIWGLIIERFMQMDVEIDGEDLDLSGDDLDSDDDDDDDDEVDEEGSDEDDDDIESGASPTKRRRIDPNADEDKDESDSEDDAALDYADGEEITAAELDDAPDTRQLVYTKLDSLMAQILAHLDDKFAPSALLDGKATPLFIILLDTFKEYVLPTHTTRSIQFLMFRVAHAHPEFLDAFLVSLIEMALNPNMEGDRRQKAMQYISSFVARAKGLTRTQIVHVVTFLSAWLNRYIIEREHEVDETSNMARFRMFYATSQALFYIFCFRHALLRVPGSDTLWEADLDKLFQRLIITKFNPLKYCKSTVVAMFARISRREDVAYCFSVMDQNRVGRFRASSQQASPAAGKPSSDSLGQLSSVLWPGYKAFTVLEGYFPFDPLSLRGTRDLIGRDYVEWDDVNDDSDSDSSSLDGSDADTELSDSESNSDYESD